MKHNLYNNSKQNRKHNKDCGENRSSSTFSAVLQSIQEMYRLLQAQGRTVLLDFLYPPRCPVCDGILKTSLQRCCDDCRKSLPWIHGVVCMKCGKPVGDETQEYCSDCRKTKHFFDQGTAPFTYSGGIRRSVYRMKFENRRDYLDFYAESMSAACAGYLERWRPDLILPVPMHRSRRRKRGYNQSELLAERISRLTGIPCDCEVLRCIRKTSAQKSLGRRERLRNLQGSFEVCGMFREGARILVVDDVYTTGSTMDEISRVLKNAGVRYVYFVVLCTGKGKKTVCTAENLCYTKK